MVDSLEKFLDQKQPPSSFLPEVRLGEQTLRQPVSPFSHSPFGAMDNTFVSSSPVLKKRPPCFYIDVETEDSQTQTASLLTPSEYESLLHRLTVEQWCILKSTQDDPLDILFNQSLIQWQLLVHSDASLSEVYLIWKEQLNLLEDPHWFIYKNGQLLYAGLDLGHHGQTFFNRQHQNTVGVLNFIKENSANALLSTLAVRPMVFTSLKKALFECLEQFYLEPLVVNHDIAQLLVEKTNVVAFLKQLYQKGVIDRPIDCHRFHAGLKRLTSEFDFFYKQPAAAQSLVFIQAYQHYYQLLTDGVWRIRLSQSQESV